MQVLHNIGFFDSRSLSNDFLSDFLSSSIFVDFNLILSTIWKGFFLPVNLILWLTPKLSLAEKKFST